MVNHDLTRTKIARWFILQVLPRHKGRTRTKVVARCECGTLRLVSLSNIVCGRTRSCGCWSAEKTMKRSITHGEGTPKSYSPEYHSWRGMKQRCTNPKHHKYKNYGGRGITLCNRWYEYKNFLADMGRKPDPTYSIERLDNNRGYEPANCIWGTVADQSLNKRNTLILTHQGQKRTAKEWAAHLGINYHTLYGRLTRNMWSVERALTTPV